MHIPDAFIPIGQALIYWVIALIFVALALRWARRSMGEEKVPLVAVLAAGIFAIQALNVPIPGGTSGHMVGAALAAIVLGSPYAGVFVLTLVLLVQGVIFGDGGITVMGANIINMGVIGGFIGYYGYTAVRRLISNAYAAAFIAGWASLFISAILCVVELANRRHVPSHSRAYHDGRLPRHHRSRRRGHHRDSALPDSVGATGHP